MCGSSAEKSYGSLGSSCAMRPPRGARHAGTPKGGIVLRALADRQHAIEGDLRPVLLLVGHGDAVVHAALDQLFNNPEQVVWRDAEHRRAETTELIERDDRAIGRDFV